MSKGKNVVKKYIQQRVLDSELIDSAPANDLELIIVVPSFKESLSDLLLLCDSLNNQDTSSIFELIIVVNNPISDEAALAVNQSVLENKSKFDQYTYPIHLVDKTNMPDSKKTGVGMARKIGLDEGLRRFDRLDKSGFLLCLDADCTVAKNYISEVYSSFKHHPKMDAVSIGFTHRIEELESEVERKAIVDYELHLRFYIEIQKWVELPFAYQTVGSAMAVTSKAYAAEGGMPVLKAGEDFYFLHKFISKNSCVELNKALVFPSGRISDRVPFGTGRAVGLILATEDKQYKTYNPQSFVYLKHDVNTILNSYPNFENIESSLSAESLAFYKSANMNIKLEECLGNTTNKLSFSKRFFQWFDAFRLMKYLHFLRDAKMKDIDLLEAVNQFENLKNSSVEFETSRDALHHYLKTCYEESVIK